jgi:hypothetical protein
MASITRINPPAPTWRLELTDQEARDLHALVANISGTGRGTVRESMNPIWEAIEGTCGFESPAPRDRLRGLRIETPR